MEIDLNISEFSRYLVQVQAKSRRTADAYTRDLQAFAGYCTRQQLDWPGCLSRAQLGLYIVSRTARGSLQATGSRRLSHRSAARAISAITSYCQFLVSSGHRKTNPLKGFKPPKYSRKLPAYYSVSEILAVLGAFDDDSAPLAVRNRAVLLLLYSTGIRVGECESLDQNSVNTESQILLVHGKGGRQRAVPFGSAASGALDDYLRLARPALESEASGAAVFLSRSGKRLTARAIQQVLDKAALRAGLAKPISPHKLRHACATHMLEGGADVRLLQELLGHGSLGTTQQYTKVTRTQLRDVYQKSHPRAARK